MSESTGKLSEKDHDNMTEFLGYLIEDVQQGKVSKEHAVAVIAHVIAAVDIGNYGEARNWFEQGRKLIQNAPKIF